MESNINQIEKSNGNNNAVVYNESDKRMHINNNEGDISLTKHESSSVSNNLAVDISEAVNPIDITKVCHV